MIPFRLIAIAIVILAASGLWYARQAGEATVMRAELDSLKAASAARDSMIGRPDTEPEAPGDPGHRARQVAELRAVLAQEEKGLKAAEKSLAEVRRKVPPIDEGEMVVSFGRITDMGAEAAQAVRGISLFLQQREETDAPKEQVQASFMKLVAWMPEIAGFEEQPAEMARFQAAVFRDLFSLDETRSAEMERIIASHFTALKASRLTAADSAQAAWRERRTAALTPLLWQLRPYMPQNFNSPEVLTQIVNVGAGLETKTETQLSPEPGKPTHIVSISLPQWPRLPWLPAKAH